MRRTGLWSDTPNDCAATRVSVVVAANVWAFPHVARLLPVEQFVPQAIVGGVGIGILPRRSGGYAKRVHC
mgnify:CR=1 FL=1